MVRVQHEGTHWFLRSIRIFILLGFLLFGLLRRRGRSFTLFVSSRWGIVWWDVRIKNDRAGNSGGSLTIVGV